ncbi:uncharacterized protein ACWYII_024653 [Salvelinus alpinus]
MTRLPVSSPERHVSFVLVLFAFHRDAGKPLDGGPFLIYTGNLSVENPAALQFLTHTSVPGTYYHTPFKGQVTSVGNGIIESLFPPPHPGFLTCLPHLVKGSWNNNSVFGARLESGKVIGWPHYRWPGDQMQLVGWQRLRQQQLASTGAGQGGLAGSHFCSG